MAHIMVDQLWEIHAGDYYTVVTRTWLSPHSNLHPDSQRESPAALAPPGDIFGCHSLGTALAPSG